MNYSYYNYVNWELSGAGNILVLHLVLIIEMLTILRSVINGLPNA